LGIGDNLDGRFLISSNDSVALGRLSYEAPLGYAGWRVGGGYSHVQYQLGGSFAALDAQGTADIGDVFLSYPLIRSRDENAYFRITGDYKELEDELRAVDLTSKKSVYGGSIGTVWEARDDLLGGGYISQTLTVYHGDLKIRDAVSEYLDSSIFGYHTAGQFTKFDFQMSRLQYLFSRNSLYLAVAGQFAGENLDAVEKLNLGGAGAVRAFPNGELLADDGYSATAEWRIGLLRDVTLSPFYDIGRGRVYHEKTAFDGNLWRTISGPGVGITWARAGNFSVLSSVAWRDHGEQFTEGNRTEPRWFWQLQKSF
jgi:hemolysin activation/secretion protein